MLSAEDTVKYKDTVPALFFICRMDRYGFYLEGAQRTKFGKYYVLRRNNFLLVGLTRVAADL